MRRLEHIGFGERTLWPSLPNSEFVSRQLRGEAAAEVSATGARTKFGRTAELVRTAHVVSAQQSTVFRVVRNIAAFNGALVLGMTGYAYLLHMPIAEIVRAQSRQTRRAPDPTFRR